MNEPEIKKILQDDYDEARENSFVGMIGDFYNRQMMGVAIFAWAWGLAMVAGAVFCGVRFFQAEAVRDQLMFAVIFLVCITWLNAIKIWSWQMIHRNNVKREIKRLELRIAELSEVMKAK